MKLTSSAFSNQGNIPEKYSFKRGNVTPPLNWGGENILAQTKTFMLVVEDPDSPSGIWMHWVLYNIPKHITDFPEGMWFSKPGLNSWDNAGYQGPDPKIGTHRYIFRLYALDVELPTQDNASADQISGWAKDHILEVAELEGMFGYKAPRSTGGIEVPGASPV